MGRLVGVESEVEWKAWVRGRLHPGKCTSSVGGQGVYTHSPKLGEENRRAMDIERVCMSITNPLLINLAEYAYPLVYTRTPSPHTHVPTTDFTLAPRAPARARRSSDTRGVVRWDNGHDIGNCVVVRRPGCS